MWESLIYKGDTSQSDVKYIWILFIFKFDFQ